MGNSLKLFITAFLLYTAFFFFSAANAAYLPGMKPGDVMCGGKILSGTGLIILTTEYESGTGNGSTFKYINPSSPAAPANYTAGAIAGGAQKFVIECVQVETFSASAAGQVPFYIGYNDAAALNGAITNPVGAISGTANGEKRDMVSVSVYNDSSRKEAAIYGYVPNGKYPTVIGTTAGAWTGIVRFYGYER